MKVIDSCNEVCLKVISTVMYFTPIGVFCTIVPVVEANGTDTSPFFGNTIDYFICSILWICIYCLWNCGKSTGKSKPNPFLPCDSSGSSECIRNLFQFGDDSDQQTSVWKRNLGVSNQISSIASSAWGNGKYGCGFHCHVLYDYVLSQMRVESTSVYP